MTDKLVEEIARAIGETLHKCGIFKNDAGDPWTDGPCLLAAQAAATISNKRIAELEEALREARGWLEHYGGDHGSLGSVLQDLDAALSSTGVVGR